MSAARRRRDRGLPVARLRVARSGSHPWIWRRMVRDCPGAEPGDIVRAVDRDERWSGYAFWNPRSEIALRVLADDGTGPEPDEQFFEERLRDAIALRQEVLGLGREEGRETQAGSSPREARGGQGGGHGSPLDFTDGYRLVHSEADLLSGVVLDRLGGVLVLELFALGAFRQLDVLRAILARLLPGLPLVVRADERIEQIEDFRVDPDPGAPARTAVREGGVTYDVDLAAGHKTGFFLDQRESRARIRALAARAPRVLDLFCYTGGFALAAASGGARDVTGVDLDERAVSLARDNARRNGLPVRFVHSDAFSWLRGLGERHEPYDVVVIDPPKLAHNADEVPLALRTYYDVNRLGVQRVREGGFLLTCSCSGSVPEDAFLDAVRRAADNARRRLQILQVSGAPPDHPVLASCPETRYLKVVLARVM